MHQINFFTLKPDEVQFFSLFTGWIDMHDFAWHYCQFFAGFLNNEGE